MYQGIKLLEKRDRIIIKQNEKQNKAADAYLEPRLTSTMELFCENS